jgi:hypothetical protein
MRRIGVIKLLDYLVQFALLILGLASMLILTVGNVYTAVLMVFLISVIIFVHSRIRYLKILAKNRVK